MNEQNNFSDVNRGAGGISRRTLLKGMGAAGLMMLAAACGATATPAPPAATTAPAGAVTTAPAAATSAPATIKKGGTFNWGEPADPLSFDPHNRNNASGTVLKRMVYQSFTRHNPLTLAVEPALATKWEYTSPTELVFTLRDGVVFHNGQAFTADDAKWNVERLIDPKTASPFANWYAAIAKVEAPTKTTIKLTLKQPDPVLPGKFAAMVVSGFAPGGSDPAALATKPIGTGPYKLTEYIQNDHVTLARNGDYWDKGIPYIDTMLVKFVPQEDTRIAALRAGQMDFSILSADSAKRLAGTPNLKFIKGVHGVFTVIKFNQRFKAFTDPRVRKAMDLATNKQEIINNALGGSGTITGPVVYGWEDYGIPPDQLPYKTDIAAAKQLMADAGYANGFEVTGVTLPETDSSHFYPGLATAAEQWKQLNIKVTLQPLELGAWLDKNNKLDYDMLIGNRGFRGDPIDVLTPHYTKAGNDNAIGYTNPQVEQWLAQAQVEQDRIKRRDLYLQVQKQVLADVPWIFLWAIVENYAMQNYVMGYDHVAFDSYKDLMATTWLNK
jgi:peptide/nickel transport system substrate-binding protein